MRNVASVFGLLIALGWIVVGAAGGSLAAIVVGVVLLGLSATLIAVPRLTR